MKPTGRKYGANESRPVPVWNGLLEHCSKIGPAVWTYLWLLDKITKERDGVGLVYGGAPVKAGRIAHDLGRSDRTIRADLKTLSNGGYLRLRRTPYGLSVQVLNSAKFGVWSRGERSEEPFPSRGTDRQKTSGEVGRKLPIRSEENCRNKEDATIDATIDATRRAQAQTQSSPFVFVGMHFEVSERQDRMLAEAFPWVGRQAEYRKADSWLEVNPNRRPKRTGRFLHNWLARISAAPNVKGRDKRTRASGAVTPPRGKYDAIDFAN